MASYPYPIAPGRRYGGTTINLDPTAYAAQRSANTQAEIQARAEAARLLAQQKSEAELAELAAKFDANKNDLLTKSNLLVMKINADKEAAKEKRDLLNRAKPVKVTEQQKDDQGNVIGTVERFVDPAVYKADQKAKQLLDLTTKRDLLKNEWRMPFFSQVPGKLAAVESEIAAANAPADLLSAPEAGGVAPVAAAPAPTPRGFIGSAGRNTFLAEPSPLGMNRAETNAYAIDLNNRQSPPPRDLLRSPNFPQGYDPGHGSFQVGEVAPVPQDAPMADFTPDAPIQDAPMAPFTPGPEDAPVKMGSPSSVYKSAEQVRDSFRAKKIDRDTAKILLEQFDLK